MRIDPNNDANPAPPWLGQPGVNRKQYNNYCQNEFEPYKAIVPKERAPYKNKLRPI